MLSGRRGNLRFTRDTVLSQIASFDYAQDKPPLDCARGSQ